MKFEGGVGGAAGTQVIPGGVDGIPDEAGDRGPHAALLLQGGNRKALPHQPLKQGPVQIIPLP